MKKEKSIARRTDFSRIARQRAGNIAFRVFRAAMIIAVGYTILSPLLQIISNSLKIESDFTNTSVVWLPTQIYWRNYVDAFVAMDYGHAFLRSLLIPVCSALIEVATCGVAAYGFARFKFPERKFLYVFLILMILVPVRITMLPSFVNYSYFSFFGITDVLGKIVGKDLTLNLIDTPFTFYLPSLFGVGYQSGIFIMIYIQFLKGIPRELEEAAWIDGAGPIRTFVRIIVPSSGVAILTVSLLSVIWHWNEYYLTGLYFSDNYPLSIALNTLADKISILSSQNYEIKSKTGALLAGCMLFILPVLIVYLFLQKKFIKSIDSVGIVG